MSTELRLTAVDSASELIYRQRRWSLNGFPRFAFVGKNSAADDERNAIGSAWSSFITYAVTTKLDKIQNSRRPSRVAQEE